MLRRIYRSFHLAISTQLKNCSSGMVVELGSGISDITEVIPQCIRTDLFPHPWADRVENAYNLSFSEHSVSNLILFDVFHHLRYPGAALNEFRRVLISQGRVIIFEPYISLLGWIVYGLLHREPVRFNKPIQWDSPPGWNAKDLGYYAAQGNATRIFLRREIDVSAFGWNVILTKRMSSISYVASGGYSRPQMYPTHALPIMQKIDRVLDHIPFVFCTRLLVVLQKMDRAEQIAAADMEGAAAF